MSTVATDVVIPGMVIALGIMVGDSVEGRWAIHGAVAGLVAVFAYDAVRMPLVWRGVWPDFIPRIGGWVTGSTENAAVGYAWRYLGDGAGIGLAYFAFCGLVMAKRPGLVTRCPIMLSIGYGVFIWSGLIASVAVPPRGQAMLFALTPTSVALSLLGHLIYGSVLGAFLRVRASRLADPGTLWSPAPTMRP
jgi:hypothetical protein